MGNRSSWLCRFEQKPPRLFDMIRRMTKPITSKQYKTLVETARKAGGDENQSHWRNRLKEVMEAPAKATAKPVRKRPVR
jgi:hypothetical protein